MTDERINALNARYGHEWLKARENAVKARSAVKRGRRRQKSLLKAQAIIQGAAEHTQNYVHQRIAGLVQKCLQAVFDDPYDFVLRFEKKRGKTEAVMAFARDGEELPFKEVGGGVVDVASFALRLACLTLMNPRPRKLLVLDEPFKFVSERKEGRERVKVLLDTLSKEMEFQIVMVTHDRLLEMGKVVEID